MCEINIKNPYYDFNMDQILYVLYDLTLGKTIISDIIYSLSEYKDTIYEIIGEIKESSYISDEFKVKVDKNVISLLNDLNTHITKTSTMKKLGSKREHLMVRLNRGMSYKYKLSNGTIVENLDLFKFDLININIQHKTINVGDYSFQISDSIDCCPNFINSECIESIIVDIYDETEETEEMKYEKVNFFIKNLQTEITKVLIIQAHLDIVLSTIKYSIDLINTDVLHFDLFDKSCLTLDL